MVGLEEQKEPNREYSNCRTRDWTPHPPTSTRTSLDLIAAIETCIATI